MAEDIADIGFRAKTDDLDRADTKLDKLGKTAKRTESATEKFNKRLGVLPTRANAAAKAMDIATGSARRFGRVIGSALAALASGLALRKFIDGTVQADAVQSQLAATLASTGGVSGQTVASLNAHAAALQKLTNYGDETTNAAQGILLSFTKIQGDTFPKATTAVLNVATALKTDLKSAAIQVGKALNDPVVGMTALSRSGITFSDAQKKIVKDMVAVGDIAGAQALILKELETQFGGSAEAARQNLGGALTALGNAFGDLFELGKSASEPLRLAIEGLVTAISNPAFGEFASFIGGVLFGVMQAAVGVLTLAANAVIVLTENIEWLKVGLIALAPIIIGAFGPAVLGLITSFAVAVGGTAVGAVLALTAAIAANPLGALLVAISAVIGYFVVFRNEITVVKGEMATLGDYMSAVWQMVMESLSTVAGFFVETWDNITGWVGDAFEKIVSFATSGFASVADASVTVSSVMKTVVNTIIGLWVGGFNSLKAIWAKLPAAIGEAAYGAVNTTIDAINWLIEKATAGVNKLITALNNVPGVDIGSITTGGIDNVNNPFAGATADLVGGVKGAVTDALSADYVGAAGDALKGLGENIRTRANEIAELRQGVGEMKTGFDASVPSINATADALGGAGGAAGGAAKKVKELGDKTAEAAKKGAEFAKNLVTGAIGDLRSALDDGKVTVQEWGDLFLNVLDKITDKLLNNVLDALFQVGDASGSAGGGSGVGNFFGQLFAGLFNAKGNAFDNGSRVTKYATGGVVNGATAFGMSGGKTGIMGEAGPEGILPLARTAGGDLGVKTTGGGGGGDAGTIVQIVDQRGSDAPPIREERTVGPNGQEMVRFIVATVKQATANGELDSVQGSRFGAKPTKVLR